MEYLLALSFVTQAILVYGILSRKEENAQLKKEVADFRKYVNEDNQRTHTNNYNNVNEIRKEIIRLKKINVCEIGDIVEVNSDSRYTPNGIYKVKDITSSTDMKYVYYVLEGGYTVQHNQVTPLKLCKKSSKKC